MISIKNLSCLLVVVLLLVSSCSNNQLPDDALRQVPDHVSSVTAFNMDNLLQKADLEYIQSLDFYKDGMAKLQEEQPELAAIMNNPFLSGVDLTKNAYVVMELDKEMPDKAQFGGLVFSIKDPVKFSGLLQKVAQKDATQRTDFKFVQNREVLIAWNDEFGIVGGGSKDMDLEAFVQPYFDAERKTPVTDNADLAKCLGKEYDIAAWLNSNVLSENEQLATAAKYVGISKEALKENYFHSFLNFEEGYIEGNSKHYLKKELTNDLKLFFKKGVSKDLAKYIPGDNLGMVLGGAIDPKGIYQVISEKTGGTSTVNIALKKYGFTSKDLTNAFSGDVAVAVYPQKDQPPVGLMTASIGDRKLFDKFVDLATEFEVLLPQGDGLYRVQDAPFDDGQSNLLITDEVFFVSNNLALLEKIKSGGYAPAERVSNDVFSTLSGNSMGGYIDFNAIKDLAGRIDEMPFETARINAGLTSSSLKMEMKNKEVNSLKALFGLLNEMYLKDKAQQEKREEAREETEVPAPQEI